jgi:hypothetical protein
VVATTNTAHRLGQQQTQYMLLHWLSCFITRSRLFSQTYHHLECPAEWCQFMSIAGTHTTQPPSHPPPPTNFSSSPYVASRHACAALCQTCMLCAPAPPNMNRSSHVVLPHDPGFSGQHSTHPYTPGLHTQNPESPTTLNPITLPNLIPPTQAPNPDSLPRPKP